MLRWQTQLAPPRCDLVDNFAFRLLWPVGSFSMAAMEFHSHLRAQKRCWRQVERIRMASRPNVSSTGMIDVQNTQHVAPATEA
jgi:hypothetical protein